MKAARFRPWLTGSLLAAVAALALGVGTLWMLNRAAPLPMPDAFAGPLPWASPPAELSLFRLPTGITHRNAAFAYRGGAFSDAREFAMTAVLVRHPHGDLLIDTGFGRHVDAHFAAMPLYFRAFTRYAKLTPAADRLSAAGYDLRRLRAILLTHAHWDHASGLADFPGIPVLVSAPERRFVDQGGFLTAAAKSANARWEVYRFEGGSYLGFAHHHDVYGDGSVVVVPAPGHTPGSVIVFIALPNGQRYAFVGDLAWQREGIIEREERPFPTRALGDSDVEQVRLGLAHMSALVARFPQLVLVPAHDARAFAEIPLFR